MVSNRKKISQLQYALDRKGFTVYYSTHQFRSDTQNRLITMHKLEHRVWDPKKERYRNEEIFSSASQIQVLLFLRNILFWLEGKEIPPSNNTKGAAVLDMKWQDFLLKHEKPSEQGGFFNPRKFRQIC